MSGIFSIPYEFEFNPAKSASNLAKHGIDFVSAHRLWQDSDRIEVSARSTNEPRQQVIGRVGSVIWSAFVAPRGGRVAQRNPVRTRPFRWRERPPRRRVANRTP